MKSDFHCHTSYSDGKNTIEEMIKAARDIGLETIAITDHVRKDTKWLADYLQEIARIKKKYKTKLNVLSGFEAKALNFNGDLDAKDEWYDLVDVVLGSIHSMPANNGFFSTEDNNDKSDILLCWENTITGLFNNKWVDIIAHPFSELKNYGLTATQKEEDILLCLARKKKKKIEISLRHSVPAKAFIKKLCDEGVELVIGSDAHSVDELYAYHKNIDDIFKAFFAVKK